MNSTTTGRPNFYAAAEQRLSQYGKQWLACSLEGADTDSLLLKLEDLTLGLEGLLACLPATSDFTATLISGLCDRHELMCTPTSPFTAIPFCLNVGGSGGTTPAHNQLSGLQKIGPGAGYYHVSEELGGRLNDFFYPPITVPTAPQQLTATPLIGGITLAWLPPLSDGGSLVTGYRVFRDSVLLGTYTSLTSTDSAVTPGTGYSYAVQAQNSVGLGPLTTVVGPIYPGVVAIPGAPTSVVAAQVGTTQAISISGTVPQNNGGGAISSYKAYREGTLAAIATGLSTPAYTDSTVSYGSPYAYRFSAVNSAGEGPKSSVSNTVTPVAPSVSTPPTAALEASPGNINLGQATSLIASSGATGGTIVLLQIYSDSSLGTLLASVANNPNLTYSWTPTTSGTKHPVVKATDSNGLSTVSTAITVQVTGPTTFLQFLDPTGNTYPNFRDTLTYDPQGQGIVGYNNPVQASASGPGSYTMYVCYPNLSTVIGQLDFDPLDVNHPCEVILGGVHYQHDSSTGTLSTLGFTNGNVLLAV